MILTKFKLTLPYVLPIERDGRHSVKNSEIITSLKWTVSENNCLILNCYLDLKNAYSVAETVDNKDGSGKYCEHRQNRLCIQRADPDEKSSLDLKSAWLYNWSSRKSKKSIK